MRKMITSVLVVATLFFSMCTISIAGNVHSEKEAKLLDQVKTGITKLGTGPSARLEVRLRDKTKLKGYVSEASEGEFVIVDDRTGAATTVAYSQVKQVKGNNLSTGAKIAIGIGIGILLMLLVVGIANGNG